MTIIKTRFTTLLNIKTPVVCAPMAGASGGALAAAVSLSGGFGLIGTAYDAVDSLSKELQIVRSAIGDQNKNDLPIGVGFLVWRLEEMKEAGRELLDAALSNNVKAVWFSFGNTIGRWVNYVRNYDRECAHKTFVFVLVNSAEEAKEITDQHLADVLIAQGIEAGGHGSSEALPLLTLIPEILNVTPRDIPVLAAGGLSNGAHVAALLTLGASGVVLGTRFLLTEESLYSVSQKEALVQARRTVRNNAFDEARGTLGWPTGIDGRGLYNQVVKNVESGMLLSKVKENIKDAMEKDDADGMVVWAGTGVGLMKEIKKAGVVVQEIHSELIASLRASREIVVID